jgi:hypothetical protein
MGAPERETGWAEGVWLEEEGVGPGMGGRVFFVFDKEQNASRAYINRSGGASIFLWSCKSILFCFDNMTVYFVQF